MLRIYTRDDGNYKLQSCDKQESTAANQSHVQVRRHLTIWAKCNQNHYKQTRT